MPTNTFRGDAQAIAQLNTYTVGGTAGAGDTIRVKINDKYVNYTCDGTETVAQVVTALLTLLQASTIPEFQEETWAAHATDTTKFTAITNEAGRPFTTTVAVTGTITLSQAVTTASSGPNHYDDPTNWTLGAVPVNGDDVVIQGVATSILYGLSQTAVNLASLTIDASYTGQIGLARYNASGYYEYRETYLKTETPILYIGDGVGSGSSLIKINLMAGATAGATTVRVKQTGNQSDSSTPALILLGTHASNSLNIQKGTFGSCLYAGEVSTWATIKVGYDQTQQTDADLNLDAGCTLGTIDQGGGTIQAQSNITTLTNRSGTFTLRGTATVTTATIESGILNYQSSGTMTTLNLKTKGVADFRQDLRGRTITNINMYGTAEFYDPNKTTTRTNRINLIGCGIGNVTLDLGQDITV